MRLKKRYLFWIYFDLASASAVWNRFLTAFCLYFCANVSALTYVNASSGHHLTHWGSFVSLSVQLLHVNTIFFSGCMFMAPNWHALMHHPQPLQAFSSTRIMPLFSSWVSASLGQAATHAGSSQCRQVIAKFTSGPMRIARIRDLVGLKVFSLTMLQAYSQTQQPMHLSGSAVTNFRSCGRTILVSSYSCGCRLRLCCLSRFHCVFGYVC